MNEQEERHKGRLKIKLVEEHGENPRFIDASINENGDLVVSGQDFGPIVRELFGDSDYEYWLTVASDNKDKVLKALVKHFFQIEVDTSSPAQDKDKTLLTLLERVYGGHSLVVTEFREFLETNSIPFKWATYV